MRREMVNMKESVYKNYGEGNGAGHITVQWV